MNSPKLYDTKSTYKNSVTVNNLEKKLRKQFNLKQQQKIPTNKFNKGS